MKMKRSDNKVEGSVLSTVTRWGKATSTVQAIATLRRLADFWELHLTDQTGITYYNYKTSTEKRLALNKKRRLAAKKKREAKNGN